MTNNGLGGEREITSYISFDVEALPGRATDKFVERLVWGELNGGDYGIRRISKILNMHKLRGNFLIDFGMCLLYGDKPVRQIVDYLVEQGHEIHAHLHSEWAVRQWGIEGKWLGPLALDRTDVPLTDALMQFTAWKYEQFTGRAPAAFRAGGFSFSERLVDSAKRAGFRLLTNYNSDRHAHLTLPERAAHNAPFRWENGAWELPVDISPEPLNSEWVKYVGMYDRSRTRKVEKTFNIVMHSWSLMHREGDLFNAFAPDHEERLHKICDHLATQTNCSTYHEYLNWRESEPLQSTVVQLGACAIQASERTTELTTCSICGYGFGKVPEKDACPGCGARARHRQLRDVFTRCGNPFDGKAVLANYANTVELRAFLRGARTVLNFDVRPVSEVEMQMDIQDMSAVRSGAIDAFLCIHVLNHVLDDERALVEIARVLKPGGVACVTIPYRENYSTTTLTDTTEHYGKDALEKYGVGTFRRYGFNDASALFSKYFEVRTEEGFDPVTRESMMIFLLTKPAPSPRIALADLAQPIA